MPVHPRTPVLVGVAQLSQRAEDPALAREPIALMLHALRLAAEDAGAPGLLARADSICVTQGFHDYRKGFFSKHTYGVYSGRPPAGGFRCEDLAAEVRALPTRAYDTQYVGPAHVEAYTVAHDAGRPARAMLAVRTPDETRSWARSSEPALIDALDREDWVGRPVHVRDDRTLDA